MRETREAGIFVYRRRQFLLMRRRDGHWNVPAGQIEDGDVRRRRRAGAPRNAGLRALAARLGIPARRE